MKPIIYLKDPEKLRNLEYQLSHPNKKSEPTTNQQQPQGPIEELVGSTATSGTVINPQTAPPANTTPSLPTGGAPEPRFSYMDISVTGIANISQHITINNQVWKSFFCLYFIITILFLELISLFHSFLFFRKNISSQITI